MHVLAVIIDENKSRPSIFIYDKTTYILRNNQAEAQLPDHRRELSRNINTDENHRLKAQTPTIRTRTLILQHLSGVDRFAV